MLSVVLRSETDMGRVRSTLPPGGGRLWRSTGRWLRSGAVALTVATLLACGGGWSNVYAAAVLAHTVAQVAINRAVNGGCWAATCSEGWYCDQEAGYCKEFGASSATLPAANARPKRLKLARGRPSPLKGEETSSLAVVSALWREVSQARSVEAEASAVERVRQVLREDSASVAIFGRDANGAEVALALVESSARQQRLRVVFTEGERRRSLRWEPIVLQSAFLLLEE